MPELLDKFDGSVKNQEPSNARDSQPPPTPGKPLSFSEVLRLAPVRRLWIAQTVSVFGDFLAVFAIIALVTFKLHGTATQVAMVLVSFMAPMAIVSPIAGVFVDRWRLKQTMIASDLIRGVLVLALIFVHDLYVIYAILFTMSVVSAFFVPAQSVAVRTLVPMAGLMAVNGLMSQAQQGSLIVALSVAGELVQLAGANSCFLYDSFSFFFSAALVMTLTIERQAPSYGSDRRTRFDAARIRLHLQALDNFVCDSLNDCRHVCNALFRRAPFNLCARRAAFDLRGVRCAEYPDRHRHDHRNTIAHALRAPHPTAEPSGLRSGRNGYCGFHYGSIRHHGIHCGGNARLGTVLLRYFHHRDNADPARDPARTFRTSDELPDVAGGGIAGNLHVRGWSSGGKDWYSEPLLCKRGDAGWNRRHGTLQATEI